MKLNKKLSVCITVVIVTAVILTLILHYQNPCLVLKNYDSNKIIKSFEINDGDTFSVTFVHSVNKSPVTDVYEIRNGNIYLTETIYYGFGAGVPTELYGDQKLSYGDNGELIISNMDTLIPDLIYVVGTVSDHTLSINGGDEISLRDLCGKNARVRFYCK